MAKNGKYMVKSGKNHASTETAQKRPTIDFNAIPYKEYHPRKKTAKNGKISSDRAYQKAKAQRQTQKAIKNAMQTSKNAFRATERKKDGRKHARTSSSYRTKKTPPTIRKP